MKWKEFHAAYEAAKTALRALRGDDNFPGLTKHDRLYKLPNDWQGERYVAIVRASSYAHNDHESCKIPITIWHWHWRSHGSGEVSLEALNENQLIAVAEIKAFIRSWIKGTLDELPPSTDHSWRIEDES